jgi:hypothetical protein
MKFYAIYRTKMGDNFGFFQGPDNWTDAGYYYWQKVLSVEHAEDLKPKKAGNELYYFRPVLSEMPLTKKLVDELQAKRDVFLGWSSVFREPIERIMTERGVTDVKVAATGECFKSKSGKQWMILFVLSNGTLAYACLCKRETIDWQTIYATLVSWGKKEDLNHEHTHECPRCNGRGIMPEFMHIAKGICFLCFGNKKI